MQRAVPLSVHSVHCIEVTQVQRLHQAILFLWVTALSGCYPTQHVTGDEAERMLHHKVPGSSSWGNRSIEVYYNPLVMRRTAFFVLRPNASKDFDSMLVEAGYTLAPEGLPIVDLVIRAGEQIVPSWDRVDPQGGVQALQFCQRNPVLGARQIFVFRGAGIAVLVVSSYNDSGELVRVDIRENCGRWIDQS